MKQYEIINKHREILSSSDQSEIATSENYYYFTVGSGAGVIYLLIKDIRKITSGTLAKEP